MGFRFGEPCDEAKWETGWNQAKWSLEDKHATCVIVYQKAFRAKAI